MSEVTMERIEIQKPKNNNRVFLGKLWKNVSKSGLEYANITFDFGIEVIVRDHNTNKEYVLAATQEGQTGRGPSIQAFHQESRPGKHDADMRLSLQLAPATQ